MQARIAARRRLLVCTASLLVVAAATPSLAFLCWRATVDRSLDAQRDRTAAAASQYSLTARLRTDFEVETTELGLVFLAPPAATAERIRDGIAALTAP